MIRAPVPVGMLFCDQMGVDPLSRRASLQGVFNLLEVDAFPTGPVTLMTFLQVSDGFGEGALQLDVLHMDEGQLALIYRQSRWAKFVDPLLVYQIEFQIKRLSFKRPGAYMFQVLFDEQFVADRRLAVVQRKGKS